MKYLAALLAVLLMPSAFALSPSPESQSLQAQEMFFSQPGFSPFKPIHSFRRPRDEEPTPPPFEILNPNPHLAPLPQKIGEQVGLVSLTALLDRHRDLVTRVLGAKPWDISVAGDSAFNTFFLTFQRSSQLVIAPLGELKRLRGEGIDVAIEPGLTYKFKVSINIFSPVRGSTLHMTPIQGTQGPKHDIKTGKILDAIKAKSYVFSIDGSEYWLVHGTDIDPKTNKLSDTKSLLFIHEAGMSSKMWPLAMSSLPEGKPVAVNFGDLSLLLTRATDGQLAIHRFN